MKCSKCGQETEALLANKCAECNLEHMTKYKEDKLKKLLDKQSKKSGDYRNG